MSLHAKQRVYVIAEVGVNHNGSMDLARQLVTAAKESGADAVKFQSFHPEALVSRFADKADYQKATTGAAESQIDMLRKLALSHAQQQALYDFCREQNIAFLSSPFDADSARFLIERLRLPRLKLGSGEITNAPLLLQIARTGSELILSTGMSTLADVEDALAVLAYGYSVSDQPPGRNAFAAAFRDPVRRGVLLEKVCLLHCVTEYPCPYEDVNLRAMDTLAAAFGLPVGYSDHTPGIAVPIAAAARGAQIIEKHLTLDRNLPGPDHSASLEPAEFAAMVTGIRIVEQALGDGVKIPARCEVGNALVARKSLVAARAVTRGELFGLDNLVTKRPGTGRSPMDYWDWLGRIADRDYGEDEVLE
ncbi:N-acetylneuraminate synthase [Methylocaldum szegediense]|jgi:N-acetylneuraminate synthase|uniref:N,N'-diacetyllegionaminic acid synthase n=1 Tax=Methylocaldum szegediense TaxID=73780 RepID=A0ABN8X942_9GAMM|nr:N-acetylneuraminate synthase [Methylocaldum szegediense]CAI8952738.1 N,N'-diacetyllegionaminic acid synthase [Methylocaldum szegediense]